MTDVESSLPLKSEPAGLINTAINIFVAPAEAFTELDQRPSKLFPLALIMISTIAAMFWYFSIVDFDWFIDDAISGSGRELTEAQLESARAAMESISQTTFKMFGVLGSGFGLLVVWVLQAGYLSMASALNGDRYKFTNWFSLVLWTSLPSLLSVIGIVVTISLSPNGQLSAYDLDPLTLANLGMQSSNGAVQTLMTSLNLTMIWSVTLIVMAYKQCLESSLVKALAIVLAPYLLILGVWAYFALT